MDYAEIIYDKKDYVAIITLNRPAALNAWTRTMEHEVRDAMSKADDDEEVRVIVVTGAGRGFCAGADMKIIKGIADDAGNTQAAVTSAVSASADPKSIDANYRHRFSYMLRLKKPVIAAINGPVAGIGLCLALFCDLRVMADGAKLTTAFARRGLIAEHGMSWMLPKLIGTMNALDLLLSARMVPAAEAAQLGLVKLLPSEGFADAVKAIAMELANFSSPRSMQVIKRQVYDSWFQTLSEAWEVADEEMAKSFTSEDFAEGVAHFVEKRAPQFTGR